MNTNNSAFPNIPLYPLRFEPIYKNYIWGGSRLRTLFGRQLPADFETAAESWEITDLSDDTSIIINGALQGYSLHDVLLNKSYELLGINGVARFPMMLKYLDAHSTLSIQVHPDDNLANEMQLEYSGKSEAWVVVENEPDSAVWIGLKNNYPFDELQNLILNGGIESAMRRIEVRRGDCFYIPPGTLHSLGAGVMVAEIQQPSNITFRVFDWNRTDKNGSPRQLHKNEAIKVLQTKNKNTPINPTIPQKTNNPNCELLVTDPNFLLYRWTFNKPIEINLNGNCSIWTVFNGTVQTGQETLNKGDSILIPANQKKIKWIPINNPPIILGEGKTNYQKN
ncbi:MAG: class I mannose-6-phosphate isomerase [Planctomycetaceae bacterium]|jgi:mannose-6-phosphate isomerase|nr:class I mannose-6-phosphate isomerase [Planctomycetaceae bacterium]